MPPCEAERGKTLNSIIYSFFFNPHFYLFFLGGGSLSGCNISYDKFYEQNRTKKKKKHKIRFHMSFHTMWEKNKVVKAAKYSLVNLDYGSNVLICSCQHYQNISNKQKK